MKRFLINLAIIGLVIVSPSLVNAQTGFYLGLLGGYSAQKPSLSNFEFEFDRDPSFVYGARLGLKFMMLAVEGVFFQASHSLTTEDPAFIFWANRQVDTNFLGVQLKYFLPLLMLQPYFSLGYGYFGADVEAIGQDRQGSWNAGVGVELHLGKKFALLGEGRYFFSQLEIDNEEMKFGQFVLSGGFNFYF